jgi:hypothetical protein
LVQVHITYDHELECGKPSYIGGEVQTVLMGHTRLEDSSQPQQLDLWKMDANLESLLHREFPKAPLPDSIQTECIACPFMIA